MREFKVGDIVEGREAGRWIRGVVRGISTRRLTVLHVEVLESDQPKHENWHTASGYVPNGMGWDIRTSFAKLSKNHIIKEIIKDLI